MIRYCTKKPFLNFPIKRAYVYIELVIKYICTITIIISIFSQFYIENEQ